MNFPVPGRNYVGDLEKFVGDYIDKFTRFWNDHNQGKLTWDSVTATASNLVPAGTLLDFGGTSVPSGFLQCDGTAVSRTTYATLFTAIGTTWGAGDGSTTFNVPDFKRRTSVGSGGSGTATLGNAVGNTGGEETHTLTTAEIASHQHPLIQSQADNRPAGSTQTASINAGGWQTGTSNGAQAYADFAGGGGAHNNIQPSGVVLKIIKT